RVVGSTRYGRVVGVCQAQSAPNRPHSRDDSGGRRLAVVHVLGGQWRDFEEGTARVQQGVDPVSGQQLASGEVALPRPLPSPSGGSRQALLELGDEFLVAFRVVFHGGGFSDCRHRVFLRLVSDGPALLPRVSPWSRRGNGHYLTLSTAWLKCRRPHITFVKELLNLAPT